MDNALHVVLGASGAIGQAVIDELIRMKLKVRAVTRGTRLLRTETINANLLNEAETLSAISGATHVYLCVSLTFTTEAWREQWPKVMQNVINACEKSAAKLIFIDNTYMYGPMPFGNPIDENHRQSPMHQKGVTRKEVAEMILTAHKDGRIKGVIGRSADFYGATPSSMLYILFLENILKGRSPQTFGALHVKHNYAFVKDNGRALVTLALDEGAYGEVWHLPSTSAMSLEEVNTIFNQLLNTQSKLTRIPKYVVRVMSIFMPAVKEMRDTLNTYEVDFVISSKKFMKRYPDFQVTPFVVGLSEMVDYHRRKSNVHINKTEKRK